mmetsp:Transcript_129837/g.375896  ORF Transcript_129837/g.375896 Transcript_129837/m.375896 type:complete len:201 (+) Transcript_129837:126-728(+)
MGLSVLVYKNFRGFREGIVVLRAHARAVSSTSVHDDNVANLSLAQSALGQIFRLTRLGSHQVTTLTAVANDYNIFCFRPYIRSEAGSRKNGNGVDSTVQRGTKDVRHARIKFQESVARFPSCEHLVLNLRNKRSGHGHQIRAWLDFKLQFTTGVLCKLLEGILHRLSDLLQVRGGFPFVSANLVSSTQVECLDSVPDLAK